MSRLLLPNEFHDDVEEDGHEDIAQKKTESEIHGVLLSGAAGDSRSLIVSAYKTVQTLRRLAVENRPRAQRLSCSGDSRTKRAQRHRSITEIHDLRGIKTHAVGIRSDSSPNSMITACL